MTSETAARLTPRQRLTRGLGETAAGPVNVTRGTVGLTAQSVVGTASAIRRGYRKSKLRKQLRKEAAAAKAAIGQEFAAAQDAIQALPQTLADARSRPNRRRVVALGVSGVAALALGAALFAVIRRSRTPEPSPLPPSVRVDPQP